MKVVLQFVGVWLGALVFLCLTLPWFLLAVKKYIVWVASFQ